MARPLVEALLGDPPPVRIELWDGSGFAPGRGRGVGTLRIRHAGRAAPDAVEPRTSSAWHGPTSPASIEADGDIFELVEALRDAAARRPVRRGGSAAALPAALGAARRLGVLGRPLPPPPEEARHRAAGATRRRRDADGDRATTTTSATTSTGSCSGRR